MRAPGDESDFDGENPYIVNVPLRELMRLYRAVDDACDHDMLDRMATYDCILKAGHRPVWTWPYARKRQ